MMYIQLIQLRIGSNFGKKLITILDKLRYLKKDTINSYTYLTVLYLEAINFNKYIIQLSALRGVEI